MSRLYDAIGGFTTIPNTIVKMLPEIGAEAFALFSYLRFRTNNESGVAFPGYDTIKKDTGLTYRKIARSLRRLESLKLLSRKKRFGNSSEYTLSCPNPLNGDRTVLHPLVGESSQWGKTTKNDVTKKDITKSSDTKPASPPDKEQPTGKELPVTGLPKSITGYGDTKPAKAKHQKGFNWGIATAIAKVCQMDFDANKKYLLKEASTLMESKNPAPTKQIILDKYGKGGWWYTSDWRGKQGQAPNPSTLRKEWGKWNGSEKQLTVNPDGSLYA